jgi:hypothetical protein
METCPICHGEMEFSGPYARCKKCDCLFVNTNGNWQEYSVIAPMRPLIARALGFDPILFVTDKEDEA